MATYLVTYTMGTDETVTASRVMKDIDERQYRFVDGLGASVALIPEDSVLSIVRSGAEESAPEYPREDGDFIILGPETLTDRAREVIGHKGSNYVRQAEISSRLGRQAV